MEIMRDEGCETRKVEIWHQLFAVFPLSWAIGDEAVAARGAYHLR